MYENIYLHYWQKNIHFSFIADLNIHLFIIHIFYNGYRYLNLYIQNSDIFAHSCTPERSQVITNVWYIWFKHYPG